MDRIQALYIISVLFTGAARISVETPSTSTKWAKKKMNGSKIDENNLVFLYGWADNYVSLEMWKQPKSLMAQTLKMRAKVLTLPR